MRHFIQSHKRILLES